MNTEYEQNAALAEKYRRLRAAAARVVEAGHYPAGDEDEARVYASQLRGLERELRHEPQPSGFATMGS